MNFNSEDGNSLQNKASLSPYYRLEKQFLQNGITYKSNQIIHRICQEKSYPYVLLMNICKLFHFNQFQIIFLCHLLNDEECVYREDPAIFSQNIALDDLMDIYNKMTENGAKLQPIAPINRKKGAQNAQQDEEEYQERNIEGQLGLQEYQKGDYEQIQYWNWENVKQLYTYLLVIGYSVKYYLNECVKPYEEQVRRKYPQFFIKVFNLWVDKYSNKVLRTNPKKINLFYTTTLQTEQTQVDPTIQIDCQYRNYNQIVEQLIKATTQNQQIVNDHDRQ